MEEYAQVRGVTTQKLLFGNALINKARNEALAHLRPEATHVLFVDDDMLPPRDALVKLLDARRPVVSALCTTRSRPVRIAAKVYNKDRDEFGVLDAVNLEHVVDGPFAPGTAFLLIDRETIAKLMAYYLSAQDWLDENTKLLNRLHVRAEVREKERARKSAIRHELWKRENLLRVFDFPVNDQELQLGEDVSVGRKLLNLGIQTSIDGTTHVGHLGTHNFGVWDILNETH